MLSKNDTQLSVVLMDSCIKGTSYFVKTFHVSDTVNQFWELRIKSIMYENLYENREEKFHMGKSHSPVDNSQLPVRCLLRHKDMISTKENSGKKIFSSWKVNWSFPSWRASSSLVISANVLAWNLFRLCGYAINILVAI